MVRKKNVVRLKKNTSPIKWKSLEDVTLFFTFDVLVNNYWWNLHTFQLVKKLILVLYFSILSTFVLADPKMYLGLEVFNNKAQCGACHILKAAGSDGQIGPNLDQIKPQILQIIETVTNGVGVMPPWKGILTEKEIEAVAYYVFNSTNN